MIWKPKRLIEQENLISHVFIAAEKESKDLEPSSYVEANSCNDATRWQLSMMEEMESLHKNEK